MGPDSGLPVTPGAARPSTGERSTGPERATVALLALAALLVLAWRWVGYQGHDDASYAAAAMQWVERGVNIGSTHWALRYTLVLPTAALIALSGPSIPALAAVSLVAYAGFLAVSYVAARAWFGWPAAAILLLIGIVLPQFPVQATYANPDLLEMALIMASFWAFLRARAMGGRGRGLLLASGLLAGLAFVTRETTLSYVLTLGVIFLFRPGMPRLRYVLIGAGFLAVVGAQSVWFAAETGDPLYRTRISASHDRVDRGAKQTDAAAQGRTIDSEGVLATSPVLAPLAAVFVSQKYGLLFLLAIPAWVILRVERRLDRAQSSVVDCAGFAALASFLFVAASAGILYVVPRYFMVAAGMAAIPTAVLAADWLARPGLRRVAAGLGGIGFVATSLALLYLENTRSPGEESIAAYIATAPAPVHLDPELARRLRYPLLAQHLQARTSTEPPAPGSLVAQTQDGFIQTCLRTACDISDRVRPFLPGPGWTELARFDPPERGVAALLARIPGASALPADLRRKIERPGLTAVIYRTPG